jgi:hypothetical protein
VNLITTSVVRTAIERVRLYPVALRFRCLLDTIGHSVHHDTVH